MDNVNHNIELQTTLNQWIGILNTEMATPQDLRNRLNVEQARQMIRAVKRQMLLNRIF